MSGTFDAAPVRIGVVGLGYWGPNIVRALHEVVEAQVEWVCDLRREAVDPLVRRFPRARGTTQFDDLLRDDELEAIVVATPVSSHAALARAALEAGKHVLVEKPLARSSAEAEALAALAERRGKVLMPGHVFLYSPPVNTIRDLVAAGDLGEIYFISSSRVNLGLHQPDVSVVWDLGPHDFSILHFWLGSLPVEVSAMARACLSAGTPDVAFVNATFDSGTIAHIELSWLAPSKLRRTAIVGSERMVVYDDTSPEPVRVFNSGAEIEDPATFGEFRLTYRTGDIVSPRVEPTEPLVLELQEFCQAVRGLVLPRASAALGIDVIRTIEAVDRSLDNGGSPVEVSSGTHVETRV